MKVYKIFMVSIILFISCSTFEPEIIDFSSDKYEINMDDSVKITWKINGDINTKVKISRTDKDFIYYKEDLELFGQESMVIDKNTTFIIFITKGNKTLSRSFEILVNEIQETNKNDDAKNDEVVRTKIESKEPRRIFDFINDCIGVSKGQDDGRFTIGVSNNNVNKRLMYGYPIPHSTSHFIVNIDNKLASNSPYLYSSEEGVCYISGELYSSGDSKSLTYYIEYEFEEVVIIQKLVPVDKYFNDVKLNNWGQHYRIEYTIINKEDKEKNVGLILLIDTMIDDNDAAQMKIDNNKISQEIGFENEAVPDNIKIYRTYGDENDLVGLYNTNLGKAVKPDKLYIGRWTYFHTISWVIRPSFIKYYDSAIISVWENRKLSNNGSSFFAINYGTTHSENLINATFNTDFEEYSEYFYFELGSTVLTTQQRRSLLDFVKNKKILGITIDGFSDIIGTDIENENVSKQRANNVKKILIENNIISEDKIILKYYGNRLADRSKNSFKKGNPKDRKVYIKIFAK